MATATRPDTTYNTYATHVLEKWYDREKASDIVFKANPTLNMLRRRAVVEPIPKDVAIRLLESKGEGFEAFHYYDIVSTAPSKGAQGAVLHPANFSLPLTMSWEEEMEFTSPQAFANRLEEYVAQQEMTMADRISRAVFEGQLVNANHFVGLWELLFPATQVDSSGSAYNGAGAAPRLYERWQARQQTDTYAGIDRNPFTADEVGGTGWEAPTVDFGDQVENIFRLKTSGNLYEPDVGLQQLDQLYDWTTWGIEHPHVIISDHVPYQDYGFAIQGKTQINRESTSMDGDLGVDNRKYRGAIWFPDEYCKNYVLHGDADIALTTSNVVMLNLNRLKFMIDSRANMILTTPRTPTDQHAGVRHMLLRCMIATDNPRMHGRIFNYGAN